jgi:DNA-directed RNA polymerase subunit beta'
MKFRRDKKITSDFSEIIISLASPEVILERSRGEVTQPETVNYRTYKPEMKGLFCERIFGPVKDWECHCGKYKRIRYKGIICDRCGVEVTEKKVRRVRMGHIDLVIPVAHIWYFRSLPNKMGYLLGLSAKKLDQIIYYERYVVIQPGIKAEDNISYMDFLTEEEYLDILDQLPRENQLLDNNDPNKFIAKMGGEALQMLLSRIQLDELSFALRHQAGNDTSQQRRAEALKRLRIVEAFREARSRIENKPEWMVMRIIPVIPAELRPLVPLEGGRFATSDLNDLYRRVIIRNNRLKRLIDIKAPEVILRNEKRMLQEAVDSLFDNSRRVNAVASEGARPLKSLSDVLKGKQGRFRQNLLGKRVDYSGRSVIVVGPELKLYECGLPKDMAAELFKPFIIRKLLERGIVKTVKSAKKIVEKKTPVVWDILENILKGHPVLLNRAPTLHRLGIQAFQPKLIEGKAIQLHPLVCTAFNADFDGDTMSVHVPLSQEAMAEAFLLMLSAHNILNPANGAPITVPSKDIVLGLYYLTKGRKSTSQHPVKGEGMIFYAPEEVIMALDSGSLSQHAHIKVRMKSKIEAGAQVEEIIDTVAGRVVFNQYVPEEVSFINEILTSKKLQNITAQVHKKTNIVRTVQFLDEVKELGFQAAYAGGMSMALDDVKVPKEKDQLIGLAKEEVDVVWNNYLMGLITDRERYNQVIDIWTRVNTQITNLLMEQLEQDQQGFNSVYMMMHSGARGSREQVRQLGGMRGLMAKPQKSAHGAVGGIIENPILSNFKEGLDVIEYFISTHGARKGLADTALKTADAGYLTRRLVDVAQDIITTEEDCGTLRGLRVSALRDNNEVIEPISDKILGRVAIHDVYHPSTEELLIPAGEEITEALAATADEVGVEEIEIRSVLTCEAERGVCIKCYGRNLATGKMAQAGEAVGVIAAQSIGEPGTQLTLRTFHVGGTASNIAVEAKIKAKYDGIVAFEDISAVKITNGEGKKLEVVMGRSCEIHILDPRTKKILMTSPVPYGAYLRVKEGAQVEKDQELCYWDPYNAVILAKFSGTVVFEAIEEGVTYKEEYDEQTGHKQKVIIDTRDKTKNPTLLVKSKKDVTTHYNIPVKARLMVEEGENIYAGQILVKIPRMMDKSRDITGGLPRVTELFEARNPSNTAVVSEINGAVTYGGIKRGNREIFIESKEGIKKKYLVPLSKHILVQDNDYIKAGDPLSDGIIAPAAILAIMGPTVVQRYLVNELQDVYRLQGVKINDKHFEVIVKQMMNKFEVIESGDTTLMPGQIIDKISFRKENDEILDKKVVTDAGDAQILRAGQVVSAREFDQENAALKDKGLQTAQARDAEPAVARPKLQGITQASLGTESFISAASFQETTKVLSEAAIRGKCDTLRGLKENVIVGHLIPAGTGLKKYSQLIVGFPKEYEEVVHAEDVVAQERTAS